MKQTVLEKIQSYPISESEIIDAVLKTAETLNQVFDPNANLYSWVHLKKDSGEWGLLYEREIRRRLNKLGKLHFETGAHNTQEDLYCEANPDLSIEIKTSQSNQFWNSPKNDGNSIKYTDPEHKTYYICVRHKVEEFGEELEGARTEVKAIYFGMLSKNDWGDGRFATYLKKDVRDENLKKIY